MDTDTIYLSIISYIFIIHVYIMFQVASFSMADLFSGIGGICGLWLGISVMTMIEMLSFLLHVIANVFTFHSTSKKVDVFAYSGKEDKTKIKQVQKY